jgi:hypothetical protein
LYQRAARQPELRADNWRNVGETPVFIVCRREADFSESGERVIAQFAQPREIPSRSPPLKVGKVLEMNPQVLG